MKTIIAALILLAASNANASYPNGFVQRGYTWDAGLGCWHRGSVAYFPAVSKGKTYYDIQPYKASAKSYDVDYDVLKSRLLDIAANRDRYELQSRERALKHYELLELADKLGVDQNFRLQNYGQSVDYARKSYSFSKQSYAAVNPKYNPDLTGQSTIYENGQALGGLKELIVSTYGSYDVAAAQDGNRRLALVALEGGLDLQRENLALDSQVQALVRESTRSLAAVAEVEAAAQQTRANAELLRANELTIQSSKPKDSSRIEIRERVQSNGNSLPGNGDGGTGVGPASNLRPSAVVSLESLFVGTQSKCGRCHNPEKTSGGLDLSAIGSLSDEDANRLARSIKDRITTVSPDKRMPPIQSGVVLETEEFDAIFQAIAF